jgi:hypothetical protein
MNRLCWNSANQLQPSGGYFPGPQQVSLRISAQPETVAGPVQRDTPPGDIQQLPPCWQLPHQPFVALPVFFNR